MKNLLLLSAFLFSATLSQAQISHDCKNENQLEKNVKTPQTADITLMIPLMGNINVKKANYKFKEATMAFQVEAINNEKDSIGYVSVDTMKATVAKEVEALEANQNALKMED